MSSFVDSLKDFFLVKLPLLLSAIVIIGLLMSGLGVAAFLRSLNFDMSSTVIPALIVEAICCYIAYQFASNFFPKESREFKEESTASEITKRKKK